MKPLTRRLPQTGPKASESRSRTASSLVAHGFYEGWIMQKASGDGFDKGRRSSLCQPIVDNFAESRIDLGLIRSCIGFRGASFEEFNNICIKFDVNSDLHVP